MTQCPTRPVAPRQRKITTDFHHDQKCLSLPPVMARAFSGDKAMPEMLPIVDKPLIQYGVWKRRWKPA